MRTEDEIKREIKALYRRLNRNEDGTYVGLFLTYKIIALEWVLGEPKEVD